MRPGGLFTTLPHNPPPAAPIGFEFWLVLADHEQVAFLFEFVRGVPGLLLTGARPDSDVDGVVTLTALPDKPVAGTFGSRSTPGF